MTDEIYKLARENVLCDLEAFASFVESIGQDEKPSAAFGPISTPDLILTAFGIAPHFCDDKPLPVARLAALDEVLRRYLDDQSAEVQLRIQKLTEEGQ